MQNKDVYHTFPSENITLLVLSAKSIMIKTVDGESYTFYYDTAEIAANNYKKITGFPK